jgi:hypothetical protein
VAEAVIGWGLIMLSETDFIALNAIYLKKMATAAAVVEATGLPQDSVAASFAAAAERGWIMDMPPSGAMLLEDGTAQVLAYYRHAYAKARADPATTRWYANFELLNTRFIAAVSEWQKTEGDERVQRRLLQIAERLAKDIRQLVEPIPRYLSYPLRLENSMDKVDAGQTEFVCKPTVDSVHNIWFEFHEDILTVLGRPRDTT